MRNLILSVLAAILAASAHAGPILLSIGADPNGVPRTLDGIPKAGSTSEISSLGDGSFGFFGLTFRTDDGRLYTIQLDSSFNSSLASVAADGTGLTSVLPLSGAAYNGGLAWQSGNIFFAIGLTSSFHEELHRIDAGSSGDTTLNTDLGVDFTGGLTFGADGNLYAISNGVDGVTASVVIIDPVTGTILQTAVLPGGRYDGGLFFDSTDNFFYTIQTDSSGVSSLFRFEFAPSINPTLVRSDIGVSFDNAALTSASAATSVPEPGTWMLVGGALLVLLAKHARNHKRSEERQ